MRRNFGGKSENSGGEGGNVQEEKKKAGKETKGGVINLCVFGHEMGQTETNEEEIDDGTRRSQLKPKQRRWKYQARKYESKQSIKKGPILAKKPNGEMGWPSPKAKRSKLDSPSKMPVNTASTPLKLKSN